ncbi:MAG: 2-oxo acid dehydrogenase subunit E2, partial [Acidobacteriota bacterium]|nr:2-oxo acid dehydrogenase subunit E2 [Acidobacteriota bacterium]
KAGDPLEVDQPVLELETDKATIEVPSTLAGIVTAVRVKTGDKVKPGQTVIDVDQGVAGAPPAADAGPAETSAGPLTVSQETPPAAPAPVAVAAVAEVTVEQERHRAPVVDFPAARQQSAPSTAPAAAHPAAPAAPSVRRLAREVGVDITQVTGTGPAGRITQADVKAFARQVMTSFGSAGQAAAAASGVAPVQLRPLPDFSKFGDVERKPMSGVRRKTSEHLSHAWNTIPHVTQFDKADITMLEQARKKYRAEVEKAGGNLTVTAVAAKVLASALKVFPQFNASVDAAGEAIVYKKYINVGIAVDTQFGLLVPVIPDADRKNLVQLSVEINQLAEKAKARKLTLDEMSGGSISITNLGGIGGTAFTPIVNWPEVAILGISRGGFEPVWTGTAFEPRLMLPLSLSYDHRLIDGADAIRFLRWVAEALESPFALALRG